MDQLKATVESSLALIEQYQWLVNTYVLDFFVDDLWARIPEEWQAFIDKAGPQDLAFLIGQDEENSRPVLPVEEWPSEILSIKDAITRLSLSRKAASRSQVALELGLDEDNQWQDDIHLEPKSLEYVFKKHIKPKKKHELMRMADLALMLSEKTRSKNKVDVGGGLGHLSRFLAFNGFNVSCLEAEGDFGKTAAKFDLDLSKAIPDDMAFKKPKHQTLNIDPDLSSDKFSSELNFDGDFGIVGLHTCGDLGPTLIRLYAESPKASHLQSVGCCYMHIKSTFPMSKYLKATKASSMINYTLMELACHAIENYKGKLNSGISDQIEKLKVHCRRALLELMLVQLERPDLRHSCLKTVKNAHDMAFEDYVLKATAGLGIELPPDDGGLEELRSKEGQYWWRVVAFYTLRLLFAPLIETVLLLDRCIYLTEQGLECGLAPVFDSDLSPRNFVIISTK